MDRSIARRLNALNARFYDAFADEFARSRSSLQPGIETALVAIAPFSTVLDVGCGDGRVGRALRSGTLSSPLDEWRGRWVGVDRSAPLMEATDEDVHRGIGAAGDRRVVADLTGEGWRHELSADAGVFDAVVCFSVLHHIPDAARRQALVAEMASLLRPGGRFAFSVWQLLHRERFRRRLRPWSDAGIDEADLEPGDLLLDWKRGGEALRYVHHFDEDELRGLCERAALVPDHSFRSDGDSGDLGLYLVGHRPAEGPDLS